MATEQPITTLATAYKTILDARGQFLKNSAEAYKFVQEGEEFRAEAYKTMQQAYGVTLANDNLELILRFKEQVLRQTIGHMNRAQANRMATERLYANANREVNRLGMFNNLTGIKTSQQANQLWTAFLFIVEQPLGIYQGEFRESIRSEARSADNFRFPGRGRQSLPSYVKRLVDLIQWLQGVVLPGIPRKVGHVIQTTRVVISGVPESDSAAHLQLEAATDKITKNVTVELTKLREQVSGGLADMLGKIPQPVYDMLQKEFTIKTE